MGRHSFSYTRQGFLKSKDAERRLKQLKGQLERGSQQVPPQQLSEFTDWLKEQQKEVGTFRTHCLNRQKQMEPLLSDLNRSFFFFGSLNSKSANEDKYCYKTQV